jgi:hypothetical protein
MLQEMKQWDDFKTLYEFIKQAAYDDTIMKLGLILSTLVLLPSDCAGDSWELSSTYSDIAPGQRTTIEFLDRSNFEETVLAFKATSLLPASLGK